MKAWCALIGRTAQACDGKILQPWKNKKVPENADDQTDQLNKPAYQIYKVLFYKQSSLTFKLKHTVPSPHGGGSNKSTSYVFFLLRKYLSADLTNFSQIKI